MHTYTQIVINLSKRESDDSHKLRKVATEILIKLGGHEKDEVRLISYKECFNGLLEDIWIFRFVTKNIQGRDKKIFEELKLKFPGRRIYFPYEENGRGLFLKKLEDNISTITEFIENINIQRLNKSEKESIRRIKKKYDSFSPNSSNIEPVRELVKKHKIAKLLNQFDITVYLKKLENNPEIDVQEVQKSVDNILDLLNKRLFISPFEWRYIEVKEFWKQKYGWVLFKEHDIFSSLKIPKDNKEFIRQLQDLHKILVESLNNQKINQNLKKLGATNTELKNAHGHMKKSIDLLELWIDKKLQKKKLEVIKFLNLLHKLRGTITHSLKADKLSEKKEFQEIVEFCKKKHPMKSVHVHEVFKSILKTSEALLFEIQPEF